MYELKKIGKVLTCKSVGTEPSVLWKKNLPGRGLTKVEKHSSKSLQPRTCICSPYSRVVFCLSVYRASMRFSRHKRFYGVTSVSRPTANLEDQGVPFFIESSPLTCPAWKTLPHSPQDSTTPSKPVYHRWGLDVLVERKIFWSCLVSSPGPYSLWRSRCTESELQCNVRCERGAEAEGRRSSRSLDRRGNASSCYVRAFYSVFSLKVDR